MNIDQLASRLGIQYYQVQYLERTKVFPKPRRTKSGDRYYTDKDFKRLKRLHDEYTATKIME